MRRFVVGLALTAVSVGLLAKLIAWQTVWGVLQAGPLVVHLRFHPPLQPADFPDR